MDKPTVGWMNIYIYIIIYIHIYIWQSQHFKDICKFQWNRMEIWSNVKIFSQLLNNKKKKKSNNNNKKMGCYPQRQSSNWCSGGSSLQQNDFKFICCCLFCPVFCPNSWAFFLVPNPRIFQLGSIKFITQMLHVWNIYQHLP